MYLPLSCNQCFLEDGHRPQLLAFVEFRDDGRYEYTCPRGHTTTTILQEQKFELLFEIGLNAILDRYYREAVSSFTASLERFYEFSLRVFLDTKLVSDPKFESAWKEIKNQSERQLGAFVMLWYSKFGEPPQLLTNDEVKFRNAVIHKGTIPTKEQAIEYGTSVLNLIYSQTKSLRHQFIEEIGKVVRFHLIRARTAQDADRLISTIGWPMTLSLTLAERPAGVPLLSTRLQELAEFRSRFRLS